MLQAERKWWI